MSELGSWSPPEENSRPLFWIVVALLLMGGLLGATVVLSGGERDAGAGGAGGFETTPFLPQSPVLTGNPAGDPPRITIIKDTRNFLDRLPTDRNTPKGWSNPTPKPPSGSS